MEHHHHLSLTEIETAIDGLESAIRDTTVTEFMSFGMMVRREHFEQTLHMLKRHRKQIIEEQAGKE